MTPTTAVPDDAEGGNLFTDRDTIIGMIVGGIAVILIFGPILCCFCGRRRTKKQPNSSPSKSQVDRSTKTPEQKPVYDYPMDGYDTKTTKKKTSLKKRKGLYNFTSYILIYIVLNCSVTQLLTKSTNSLKDGANNSSP